MINREEIQKEVDTNYQFFKKELNRISSQYNNKYILLKNAQVVESFDTIDDAIKYAKTKFEDGLYSIQNINEVPANLGFIGSL
ncbi:DUF5678 domain-containing protein [Brachyspira pilosicoli]|uniref:DUF5678 domain-containing protein n=1 Tax=Brachyspira pilosicoli TaxID=52584 RepID=UPI0030071648